MRKEVKKALENVESALEMMKRLSERDTIPEKVRKKSADVASGLKEAIDGMNSILNTYST